MINPIGGAMPIFADQYTPSIWKNGIRQSSGFGNTNLNRQPVPLDSSGWPLSDWGMVLFEGNFNPGNAQWSGAWTIGYISKGNGPATQFGYTTTTGGTEVLAAPYGGTISNITYNATTKAVQFTLTTTDGGNLNNPQSALSFTVTGTTGTQGVSAGATNVYAYLPGFTYTAIGLSPANALPTATIGSTYNATIAITGGTPPYTVTKTADTTTCTWPTVSVSGNTITIGAWPIAVENQTITLQVSDSASNTVSATYTIPTVSRTGYIPNISALTSLASGAVNTAAYQALNVPAIAAGGNYTDPVTGLTVYKLTSPTVPATNANGWCNEYSTLGLQISQAWGTSLNKYTIFVLNPTAGGGYLCDYTLGGTVGNWRAAPAGEGDICFSRLPGEAQILYYTTSTKLNRYNTATNALANTGSYPYTWNTIGGSGANWLQFNRKHTWATALNSTSGTNNFTALKIGTGNGVTDGTVRNAATGVTSNEGYSGYNDISFAEGSGSNDYVWNMNTNTLTNVTYSTSYSLQFHSPTMPGYWSWYETNQGGGHEPIHRISEGGTFSTPATGSWYYGYMHTSGHWTQSAAATAQYGLSSFWNTGNPSSNTAALNYNICLIDQNTGTVNTVVGAYTFGNNASNGYRSQPHATISDDGLIMIFSSDMFVGSQSSPGQEIEVFLVEMPKTTITPPVIPPFTLGPDVPDANGIYPSSSFTPAAITYYSRFAHLRDINWVNAETTTQLVTASNRLKPSNTQAPFTNGGIFSAAQFTTLVGAGANSATIVTWNSGPGTFWFVSAYSSGSVSGLTPWYTEYCFPVTITAAALAAGTSNVACTFPTLTYNSYLTAGVTYPGSGNVLTASASYTMSSNQQIVFAGTVPTGLTAGVTYFVAANPGATTFSVSATSGGAIIALSGTASGMTYSLYPNLSYGREQVPFEWPLSFSIACNQANPNSGGLWHCMPLVEDGTNQLPGSYSTNILTLVNTVRGAPYNWTGKMYMEYMDEPWNGDYNSYYLFNQFAYLANAYTAGNTQGYYGYRHHYLANIARSTLGSGFGTNVFNVFAWQGVTVQYGTVNAAVTGAIAAGGSAADMHYYAAAQYMNPIYTPTMNVSAITAGATTTVTTSASFGSQPFQIGCPFTITGLNGLWAPINGVSLTPTAVGGSSGAWTATFSYNSTGYGAISGTGLVVMTISQIQAQTNNCALNPVLIYGGIQTPHQYVESSYIQAAYFGWGMAAYEFGQQYEGGTIPNNGINYATVSSTVGTSGDLLSAASMDSGAQPIWNTFASYMLNAGYSELTTYFLGVSGGFIGDAISTNYQTSTGAGSPIEKALVNLTTNAPTYTRNVIGTNTTIPGNCYGDSFGGANPTLASGAISNPVRSGGYLGYHVYCANGGTFSLSVDIQSSSGLTWNVSVGVSSQGSPNVNQFTYTNLPIPAINTNERFGLGTVTLPPGHSAITIGYPTAQPNISILSGSNLGLTFSGTSLASGSAAIVESSDKVAGIGSGGSLAATGSAAVIEGHDIVSASGTAGAFSAVGNAAIVENHDVVAAAGTGGSLPAYGSSAITESNDVVSATGSTGAVPTPGPPLVWTTVVQNLTINQYATYENIFTLDTTLCGCAVGSTAGLVNLTGYTAQMQIRDYLLSNTILYNATPNLTVGGANGTVTLEIPAAATTNFTWWRGVYDLILTDAFGNVTRAFQGSVDVIPGVTP